MKNIACSNIDGLIALRGLYCNVTIIDLRHFFTKWVHRVAALTNLASFLSFSGFFPSFSLSVTTQCGLLPSCFFIYSK